MFYKMSVAWTLQLLDMQLEWGRFTLYRIMIVMLASVVMNLVSNESVFRKKSPWPQVFRQKNYGGETSEEAVGTAGYQVGTQLE